MAENIIESTIEDDGSTVKSLAVTIDQARLIEMQDALQKGGREKSREFAGMNAFITHHLNKIDGLRAKAAALRANPGQAVNIGNAPQVGGISIPVEQTVDPVIAAHNEEVGKIDRAIQEFNADRSQFLANFISRYIAPPTTTRMEPRVGQRVPQRTGPDYFTYMRDRQQEPLTPEQLAAAKYAAFLETPDAKKFDTMSEEDINNILNGFRTQGLGKAVSKYEGMPDREVVKRMMFDMKTGSVTSQIDAGLRMIAQYLLKK